MLNFLRRKKPDAQRESIGVVLQEWERKRLPDAGAENFAFLTLDLPPMTQIGAGVAVRRPRIPTQYGSQPYIPTQHVSLQGIGQVSGAIISQPLYNPKFANYGGLSGLRNNDAMPRAEIIPAGALTL